MQAMAKQYTDKGMSFDTAMVRVAKEESSRLMQDRQGVVDLVTPKKESSAPKAEEITPESIDRARSEEVLEQTPDMTIRLAPGQEVNAKEYLAKLDEEIKLAQADEPLYKVAVACALGRNAE